MGVDWCAIYTDNLHLRFYSLSGIEFFVYSVPNVIISMCGYENLLAYVYTVSLGLFGTQNLRFKIVDITTFEDLIDDQLPISPYSTLNWFGFSEDGYLISADTDKIVRTFSFNFGKKWVPIGNLKESYENTNIWILGAQDEELYIVDLKFNDEPVPGQKLPIKLLKFNVPTIKTKLNDNSNQKYSKNDLVENTILNNKIFINHEVWREKHYRIYKEVRSSQNPDHYYTDNLKDSAEIIKNKKENDKIILDLMNKYIQENQQNKVEHLYDALLLTKSKSLAINFCQTLGQNKLVESLQRKLMIENEKNASYKIEEQQQKSPKAINSVVNRFPEQSETENKFSNIALNIDIYKTISMEESNNAKQAALNNNAEKDDSKEKGINQSQTVNSAKLNNPFVKSGNDDGKVKSIYEDFKKTGINQSQSSQANGNGVNKQPETIQKIGFKRKNEVDKKIVQETVPSKLKK